VSNPLLGIGMHGVGALSSSLCYTPQKKTVAWSWQTYWMAQAAVCWLLLPCAVAALTTPHLGSVLVEASRAAMLNSFLLGLGYGIGGTAFGVSIRYLGFSVTYALSIGISSVVGTLLPPLLSHQMGALLHRTGSDLVFAGIVVATIGIFISGWAGWLRDRDSSSSRDAAAQSSGHLRKGIVFAVVAGLLSAVFGLALAAGQPLADTAARYGAGQFQGNVILIFACGGAFVTTALICVVLHMRQGSLREYIAFADGPSRRLLGANYALAALTGVLWYGQFFFYGIAHTLMGRYAFVSWALHMTMLVFFSAFVGVFLREWRHCRPRTIVTLAAAMVLLVGAVAAIGWGTYQGAG
jgi:L-rhamnose-H+ transport protein